MVVVPLAKPVEDSGPKTRAAESEPMSWTGLAAGGTLLASGLLLLTGHRRAGLVAATAGATLAMLDQKETARTWWNLVPVLLDEAQRMLSQVEAGVEEIAAKREKVRQIFAL